MPRSTMPGFSADTDGQGEAHHGIEAAAIDQQAAVRVVDAGARLGRRDQRAQHRCHALRIDRKIQRGILVRAAIGLARLEVEQPVGVDGDGVGLHRRGRRDRAGDDLRLHQQALRARVDQAGAELRQIEDARHQRDQAGEVERDDAAGQAREGQREEELPGALQPVQWTPAPHGQLVLSQLIRSAVGGDVLGVLVLVRLRSVKQCSRPR
ncbi:hypothetical protein ACVWZL_008375 [Bradyrhizobium sp. GM2.4]